MEKAKRVLCCVLFDFFAFSTVITIADGFLKLFTVGMATAWMEDFRHLPMVGVFTLVFGLVVLLGDWTKKPKKEPDSLIGKS
jgi:hypothetical protein